MKTAATAFALMASLVSATPAAALSCLPSDPVRLYTQARDAEARFRIIHGTLTASEPIRRHESNLQQSEPRPIRIKARMTGTWLGAGGFASPFDAPVEVHLVCFGPWCGDWPGEAPVLAAVEEGEGGTLYVTSDPCFSRIYQNPTSEDLRRVVSCHAGGDCVEVMR